jgi:hypothetical protein
MPLRVGFPVEIRLGRLVGIPEGHGWPIASCVSYFAFPWTIDLELSDVDLVVPEDYKELCQLVHPGQLVIY